MWALFHWWHSVSLSVWSTTVSQHIPLLPCSGEICEFSANLFLILSIWRFLFFLVMSLCQFHLVCNLCSWSELAAERTASLHCVPVSGNTSVQSAPNLAPSSNWIMCFDNKTFAIRTFHVYIISWHITGLNRHDDVWLNDIWIGKLI